MSASSPVFIPAYAKINLTLAVLGKRPDGYHELASVMQTISLHDTLAITANSTGSITCETDLPELQSPENLTFRAAHLLRAEAGAERCGATIELRKTVPTQGGLGGGSSDGAAVLTTLSALWGLRYPSGRLYELAARLGSDVPFFITGGTCAIGGRGEFVTPLPDAEPLWLVLAKPPVNISTASIFRALTPADYATGADTAAVIAAITEQRRLPFEHLTNSLEPGVLRAYPEVAATREALLAAGAPLVRMSGSGPSLYAPFRQLAEASAVLRGAQQRGVQAWLCHSIAGHVARQAMPMAPAAPASKV